MLASFAVIIPMYNEERGAENCVRVVQEQLKNISNPTSLIVVDDGSSDNTAHILKKCVQEFSNLEVIHHQVNKGYGAALQTGVKRASEMQLGYAAFMDSDLTNDPKDLSLFADKMAEDIDVIKASRYISGGSVKDVPISRRFISYIGNLIGQTCFGLGIKDCTNGFRAVKIPILSQLELKENRFEIIVEELYHCKFIAKTFDEIPVELGNRKVEQRSTAFSYRPATFYKYLKYALLAFLKIKPKYLARGSKEL